MKKTSPEAMAEAPIWKNKDIRDLLYSLDKNSKTLCRKTNRKIFVYRQNGHVSRHSVFFGIVHAMTNHQYNQKYLGSGEHTDHTLHFYLFPVPMPCPGVCLKFSDFSYGTRTSHDNRARNSPPGTPSKTQTMGLMTTSEGVQRLKWNLVS